jgi:hypothetical protein
MPESGPFGFVRGAPSNGRPYCDPVNGRPNHRAPALRHQGAPMRGGP